MTTTPGSPNRPPWTGHCRSGWCVLLLSFGVLARGTIDAKASEQNGSGAGEQQAATTPDSFFAYGASALAQELIAVRFQATADGFTTSVVQREPLGCEAAPVVFHARHRLLYVASLRAQPSDGNRILTFAVDDRGRLSRRHEIGIPHGSAYLSLDRSGRYLLSASYFQGHVDVFPLDNQGLPQRPATTLHEGRDKAHAVLTSRTNRFAYVPYVKDQNALFQYAFDEKDGKLRPLDPARATVPEGTGPRHIAYHPTRPFVFFSNEQQLGASSYRIRDGGQLELIQVCAPGELKPAEGLAASDIEISRDGRFLFVGVRDFNQGEVNAVHSYRVAADGTLAHVARIAVDAIPWGLQLAPAGKHLLVTAAQGGTLTAYALDAEGKLSKHTAIRWGKMVRGIAVVAVE